MRSVTYSSSSYSINIMLVCTAQKRDGKCHCCLSMSNWHSVRFILKSDHNLERERKNGNKQTNKQTDSHRHTKRSYTQAVASISILTCRIALFRSLSLLFLSLSVSRSLQLLFVCFIFHTNKIKRMKEWKKIGEDLINICVHLHG